LLIVGGGSLLHDRGRIRNLIMVLDEIGVAKFFGRRIALFAMGVGPLHRRISRWLVTKTPERAPWNNDSSTEPRKRIGVFLLDSLDISPQDKRVLTSELATALEVMAHNVANAMKNSSAALVFRRIMAAETFRLMRALMNKRDYQVDVARGIG
jgi:hypothetical protein